MWVLDHKESWALKNWCVELVLEKILERTLDSKDIQPGHPKGNQPLQIYWKDWCWSWSSNILATWCEELTHQKRPCCWERLKAGGEGDERGWDCWMASLTQRTCVWAISGRVKDKEAWCAEFHGVAKNQTWLSNWTTTTITGTRMMGAEV